MTTENPPQSSFKKEEVLCGDLAINEHLEIQQTAKENLISLQTVVSANAHIHVS